MSYPPNQPPVVPGPHQSPAWPPAPPQKPKRKPLPWILGGIAVVLLLCVGFAGLGAALDKGSPGKTDDKNSGTVGSPVANTTATTAAAPPIQQSPQASDFALTAKITEKQCFGSAGCNVDLQVKMAYSGPKLSDDDTWQVTYELTGDESGPIVGSIDVTGTTYDVNEETLSTKSSKTKITIKVTDVEKRGL